MRWFIATWLLTLRVFAADPFFDAQFQALAQFNPYYVGGLQGDWSWASPGQYLLNGTGISATYDRSGKGNNLTNGTAANQPLISRADNSGNLLKYSEQFDNAVWTKSQENVFGATDTGAAGAGSFANTARTTDPVGGNNADFIQEDTSASTIHLTSEASDYSAGIYSLSVCVKQAGRSWVCLQIGTATGYCLGYFNSAGGTTGTTVAVSATFISATSENLGNGWWRFSITGSFAVPITRSRIYLATADNTITYTGDNTSGLFLYGASLRPASWSPIYVPTGATIALPGLNGLATAYFDGVDDFLKSAAFTLNQPTFVVMVAKQVTWTVNDGIYDGNTGNSMRLYQQTISPIVGSTDGSSATPKLSTFSIGEWGIVSEAFNGTNTFIRLNRTTPVTGAQSSNAGGFTLGAKGDATSFGNIQVARVLVYNRIPSAAEQDYIVRGLAVQYGLNP